MYADNVYVVNFKGSPITLATLCARIWNLCFMFKQLLDYAGQRIMFSGAGWWNLGQRRSTYDPQSKIQKQKTEKLSLRKSLNFGFLEKMLLKFSFLLSLFFHCKTKNKSFTVNHKWMKVSCNFPQKSFSTLNFQSSLFANELNLRGWAEDEFTLRIWFITFCRWLRWNLGSNLM